MLQKLFNPDNALMITMSQITDCIFLSLFWLLGCVPLVTVGASSAALYDAAFRAFRQGDKHSWRRFFGTFRRNWKAGILPSLVFLAVFALAAWLLIRIWNAAVAGTVSRPGSEASSCGAALPMPRSIFSAAARCISSVMWV